MADYLRLRLRMTLRAVAVTVPGRMVALVAAGMILAAGIQFLVLGDAAEGPTDAGVFSSRLQAEVGYAVLLLAAFSLVTGPQSSRFPCTPADVAWVYASPLTTRTIVLAQLVWLAARRCTFWVLGGVIADVVATVALDSDPGFFISRAVLATPLLVALVIVSVGAGSTRGSRAPAGATMVLGGATTVAVLAPLVLKVVVGSTPGEAVDGAAFSSLARSLGAILFGRYDLLAAAGLAAMVFAGAALCRAGGPGLREQLTLDAVFWAEFTMTPMRSAVEEPKPSFRHLSGLTGPWSILWFEVAVLRRANWQRWSFGLLLATSILTGGLAPEFIPLFAFAAPLGVVTGAYLSGVARHLRLRTLLLVPGRMTSRVVAAEAVHGVLAFAGLVLSLAAAGMAGGYGAGAIARLSLQGLVLLTAAFGIRVGTAALAYRDGVLPGGRYHLTLTVMTAAGTSAIVLLAWLASKVDGPTWVALVVLLGAASTMLAAALRLFDACAGPADTRQSGAASALVPRS
ncbi:MAG: hypothetical protein M3450_06250 [Actinomycetota bacterium]|nr:hypothetical protein [Actinomycetota bacterium]